MLQAPGGAFKRPHIEGHFEGDRMRAWDVVWGAASGNVVIENNYLELTDGRIERTGGQVEVGALPTLEADPLQMRQMAQLECCILAD